MNEVKDYQKRWNKFIEQIIIRSKHWSKCQKIWASEHILEQLWINPDYGVPTALPRSIFWKIADRFQITEFCPEIPLTKHSCYYIDPTYSINHKKPVPLEVTIGIAELICKAVNHLNKDQLKRFNKIYKKNINDPTLGTFKIDHMFLTAY